MTREEAVGLNELPERDVVVTYSLADDEAIEDGLLTAFDAIGFDLLETGPPLVEFLNPHALERLQWDNPNLRVVTSVWEYPVLITADEITIYSSKRRT